MAKKAKGDSEDSKKKSKLPIIIIIIGVLLAAGGYKFGLAPKKPPAEAAAGVNGAGGATTPTTFKEGEVVALPDLTINLADRDPRYLRVGIALILQAGTSTESMKTESAKASDAAIKVLSKMNYDELHSADKDELKTKLSEAVRESFEGKKVARVIFTSFVMQ
jgi:flagellar basal body-associated protein FliL